MQEIDYNDTFFMKQALIEAQRAAQHDEVPIGAIIVDPTGNIVARAHNRVEQQQCQLAHAELLAITQACAHQGNWRLSDHWIYVTLEPCSMCIFALVQSRIAGIVYGVKSPLFGFHLDIQDPFTVYKKTSIVKGVCSQESERLLKEFFNKKRKTERE